MKTCKIIIEFPTTEDNQKFIDRMTASFISVSPISSFKTAVPFLISQDRLLHFIYGEYLTKSEDK